MSVILSNVSYNARPEDLTTMKCLLLVFLLFVVVPARAQEMIKPAETNVSDRVRLLESELERQNTKLDQLQKTLQEQQATIQALLEKLSAHPVPATAAATKEAETPVPVTITAEPQTPTVEQRLTKLEGQLLKIGPIR